MPPLNIEEYFDTDSSDNEENHSKLLSAVSQLDNTQRVKPAQRREITSKVSEHSIIEGIKSEKNLITAHELVAVLGKSSKDEVTIKKFKNIISKSKTLPKPLEKPLAEKIKRCVGFENVKNELRRWDAIVKRNSLKDQIKFPLNDNSVTVQNSEGFLNQFENLTPLEEQIAKVLNQEHKEDKPQENKFSLTMEEMLEKRREMAYVRARLSYKAAKAHRQNKIKSKKYHRILKREKLKQQLKEFELLQKTDPEAALKKLSELDRTRAQERASLRHRNTGHWAKNLSVRAKYDVESRKVLADQLRMSRELTKKVQYVDESDKEEPEELPWSDINASVKFEDNPWNLNMSKEVHEFVNGYKKYWSEQNKTTQDLIKTGEKDTEKCEVLNKDSSKNDTECIQAEPVISGKRSETSNPQKKTKSVSINPGSGVCDTECIQGKPMGSEKKSKKSNPQKRTKSISIDPGSGVCDTESIQGKPMDSEKKSKKSNPQKRTKSISIDPGSGVCDTECIQAKPVNSGKKSGKSNPQKRTKSVSIDPGSGVCNTECIQAKPVNSGKKSGKSNPQKRTKSVSIDPGSGVCDTECIQAKPVNSGKKSETSNPQKRKKSISIDPGSGVCDTKCIQAKPVSSEKKSKKSNPQKRKKSISIDPGSGVCDTKCIQGKPMGSEKKSKKSNPQKRKKSISIDPGSGVCDTECIQAKPVNSGKKFEKSNPQKRTKSVSIYPGSGVWVVAEVSEESNIVEKKRKGEDIDKLFEELDEKLIENAQITIKEIKCSIESGENKQNPPKNEIMDEDVDLSLKNKNIAERPEVDAGLLEGDDMGAEIEPTENFGRRTVIDNSSSKSTTNIDPNNFIQLKPKRLRTCLPDNVTFGEDNVNDEKSHMMSIEEAFADDDVIAEFKEMKEEAEESDKIEIETSLLGWGSWVGAGIKPKTRKKSLLVLNPLPRKDKEKIDTIINENANRNLKNHLVKEVPHPFKSVEAFEANIRAPLGREWVPETAHWKLIQKPVVTKLGSVIEPMDENEIVRQKTTHASPYQGKVTSAKKKST